MGLTRASLQDADFSVTRLLGAEIDLRIPTISLLQHLHNFQFVRRPLLDNTICDLVSRYDDLKVRVEQAKATDFRRLALKPLAIPPIALRVMQRAYSYEQLTRSILEVREEFRALGDEGTCGGDYRSRPIIGTVLQAGRTLGYALAEAHGVFADMFDAVGKIGRPAPRKRGRSSRLPFTRVLYSVRSWRDRSC